MRAFERVVAENGFAACARKLDISPAVVTRRVGDLEDHLGVRLLQRTTRRLALTPAGEAYLDRVRGILAELEDVASLGRFTACADGRQIHSAGRSEGSLPLAVP